MLKIMAMILLFGLVNAQIDRKNCVSARAWYGQVAHCPSGYVAVQMCSSGAGPACRPSQRGHYSYAYITCCKATRSQNMYGCETHQGKYGAHLNCNGPSGGSRVVTSVCTSGKKGDCGKKIWTRITCCKSEGLHVSSQCEWIYGVHVACKKNEVMTGVCSSGKKGDCWGSRTAVRCCQYS